MKRLLPGVVLIFAAGASCLVDREGLSPEGAGGEQTTFASSGNSSAGGESTTTASATTAAATTAAVTAAVSSSSTGGGSPGWTRRRKLDLDSGQISPANNFPMLVVLKSSRIDYGQTLSNGRDLRFVDENGTVLPHEVELWVEGGTSLVWVRVPLIKPKPDVSSLYMYYGNPSAPDVENANGVWAEGYRGVWHLNEGGESFTDASGKTATSAKNYGSTVLTDSVLGKGRSFKATNKQYIDTLNSEDLPQFTIEVWARSSKAPLTGNGPNGPLMRDQNYNFFWDHPDASFIGSAGFTAPSPQGSIASDLKPLNADTWYYLAATYDGAKLVAYKNGVKQAGEITAGTPLSDPNTAKIGRHAYGTAANFFFNGDIDEVRITQVARSDRWIAAQYKSMTDSGFVTFGPEATGAWEQPLQQP